MTVKTVRLEDGSTIDIDLADEDWSTAKPAAAAPAAGPPQGTPARDDAAWAEMRRKAQEGETAVRTLAFLDAGIDPKADPRHEDFMKVYDGKMEKADIVAAAQVRGYLPPPADPNAPTERTPEQAASIAAGTAISTASVGAPAHQAPAEQRLQEAYDTGGQAAMVALAKELGVPVDAQQDYQQASDAVGWGASAQ